MDMTLTLLAPDVYACLQPERGMGWSNSGFIASGGGMVVDTFWDLPRTRAMLELYAAVHPEPPRRLVNTHHNGDHTWGNQLLRGAEIIGHRLCVEAMKKDIAPEVLQQLARSEPPMPGLERLARALRDYDFTGIDITLPTTLFEQRFDVDLGSVHAEVLYVGPAHTLGDSIVHLPESRVVFAGDVLFHRCTPVGWEGSYAAWLAALDRIIELEPDVVVPGHGPLTDVSGVRDLKAYFLYVQAESARFYEQGLSEMDAARRIDLGPYADWTEPERLIFNVRRAYRELRGEPLDAPLDAIALMGEAAQLAAEYEARRGA